MSETIQHYDHLTQKLTQPFNKKAQKLIELGNITKVTDGLYSCAPIPGYNTRTYAIRESMGETRCNCQAGRKGRECSHIQAVRMWQSKNEPQAEKQLTF